MPRIPLPVKLLLSYLGVLLLGAGPTFFYIRVVLQGDLLRESSLRMSSQIQKVAESLRSVPDDERLQVLRKFGEISTHRLTYMSLAGDVLLENSVVLPLTINHASRSEVRMAMAEPASKPEGLPVWTGLHGTGYARRHSETTGFAQRDGGRSVGGDPVFARLGDPVCAATAARRSDGAEPGLRRSRREGAAAHQ